MSDIRLDINGDLFISDDGQLQLINTIQDATRQRVEISLQLFQGEWYLDTTEGLPYFQTILVKGTPTEVVDSIFRNAIQADEQIQRILSFESTRNNTTYNLRFSAVTNSGEIITVQTAIDP